MHIYFTFILFLTGLVLASFLNALLYRIDNGYKYPDIFIKGSHCEKCNKQLKTYELIPILSFFIFKGKCSKCGYKVPVYYPLSELMLAIGFASIYFYSLSPILYLVILFFFSFSYFDRVYKSIPAILVDIYLGILVIYFFIMVILQKGIPENGILIGLTISLLALILGKLFKKPFGIGDILVLIGLSLVLTVPLYVGFIYIFLIVSSIYSLLLVYFKKATLKSSIPLLPFMFVSLSTLLFLSEYIVKLIEDIYYF